MKNCLCDLNPEQLELLLTVMTKDTSIKVLEINWVETIDNISPALFASAISNVVEVTSDYDCVENEQMNALIAAITSDERRLKMLTLDTCVIKNLDPDMLGIALNRLEEVTVTSHYECLSEVHVNAIIRTLVGGKSKLKKLMLGELDHEVIGALDQELVSMAKGKIGEFYETFDLDTDSDEEFEGNWECGRETTESDEEFDKSIDRLIKLLVDLDSEEDTTDSEDYFDSEDYSTDCHDYLDSEDE